MIAIDDYGILKGAVCSLKETSKTSHDGTICYMTESSTPVVNFDVVKNQYIRGLSVPEAPSSNDAFFVDSNGEMFFIEFKAGRINEKKFYKVRLKLYDSLLILTDIIGRGISFTRQHLNYVLVYDESINPNQENDAAFQATPSREQMSSRYMKKGGDEFIRGRMRRFQRL